MNQNAGDEQDPNESIVSLKGFRLSVRAFIAILTVGTVCVLSLLQVTIEEPLYSLVSLVTGVYLGAQLRRR